MKQLLIITSAFISLIKFSAADPIISKDFEFAINFPVATESMRIDHPLGPIISYVGVDEQKIIIYQVQAQKAKFLNDLESPSQEKLKKLNLSHFEGYIKESEGLNVKWKWMPASDWPMIEFSCEQIGFIQEGLRSYKKGYSFIKNGKIFKLTVDGVQPNQDLDPIATKFMASFFIPDKAMIDAAK